MDDNGINAEFVQGIPNNIDLTELLQGYPDEIDLSQFIGELEIRHPLGESLELGNSLLEYLVAQNDSNVCVFGWIRFYDIPDCFQDHYNIEIGNHGCLLDGLRINRAPTAARIMAQNKDEEEFVLLDLNCDGNQEWNFECIPLISIQACTLTLVLDFDENIEITVDGRYGFVDPDKNWALASSPRIECGLMNCSDGKIEST